MTDTKLPVDAIERCIQAAKNVTGGIPGDAADATTQLATLRAFADITAPRNRYFHKCGQDRKIRTYSSFLCSNCRSADPMLDFRPEDEIAELVNKVAELRAMLKHSQRCCGATSDSSGMPIDCPDCSSIHKEFACHTE